MARTDRLEGARTAVCNNFLVGKKQSRRRRCLKNMVVKILKQRYCTRFHDRVAPVHRCEWPERNCELVAGARLFGDFRKSGVFGGIRQRPHPHCGKVILTSMLDNLYCAPSVRGRKPLLLPRRIFFEVVPP